MVGEFVAEAVDVGIAGEDQVFEIGVEDPADGGLNGIVAFAGELDRNIAQACNRVGVVAEPTIEIVIAAAGQEVVAAEAVEGVRGIGPDQNIAETRAPDDLNVDEPVARRVAAEALAPD